MFLAAQLDHADKNVRILEPSAGCGGIVSVLRDQGFTNIDLVELDPINAAVLSNAGYRVYQQNFLDFQPAEQYDYVLMNPPFSVKGDKEAYVTHILHAWSLLKEGGTLVAITPNGITFKDHKRVQELRELMARYNGTAIPIAAGEGTKEERGGTAFNLLKSRPLPVIDGVCFTTAAIRAVIHTRALLGRSCVVSNNRLPIFASRLQ